jgi:glycosyltransferase involved in cell wall biosynthesis
VTRLAEEALMFDDPARVLEISSRFRKSEAMGDRIFQVIPVLDPDDALCNHARRMAEIAGDRHGGFIVERAAPSLRNLATHWTEAKVKPSDVLIYHAALGSRLSDWLKRTQGTKIVDFHNITPPEFFRVYEPGLSVALANGRRELQGLARQVSLAIGHSEYSRVELEELGFSKTQTLPLLIGFERYEIAGNENLIKELSASKSQRGDILFVGRISPNKRQEDLIKAFAVYKRAYRPAARLFLVGGTNSNRYLSALESFVRRLGVEDVVFTGRASIEDLVAYYRTADLFLSMSEHEGFGAPFLEAMHFGVPVIAFAATAIPETVASGGLLLTEKRFEEIAALIDLVMRDEGVRGEMIEAGRARVADFRPQLWEAKYREAMESAA